VQDFATALQESSQQAISAFTSASTQRLPPEKHSGANTGQGDPTFIKTPLGMPGPPEIGPEDPTEIKIPSGASPLPAAPPNNLALPENKTVSTQVQRPVPDKDRRRTKKVPLMVACFILLASLVAIPFLLPLWHTLSPVRADQPSSTTSSALQHTKTPTQQTSQQSPPIGQATQPSTQQSTQPPTTPNSQSVQRTLSSTQTQSSTVTTTGQGVAPATQAKGSLTFHAIDVFGSPAGATFPGGNDLTVVQDQAVNILQTSGGTVTVPAHVAQAGAKGNLASVSTTIRSPGGNVTVASGPFTGGTDAQQYTFVLQSDVDNAAAPLKSSTTQAANTSIQQQLQSGEHLVGNPQCTPNVTSNHVVNDRVSTVTVTVSTTCTATAST
jgi:hypothetical protein